jgi:hypothetical protein
VGCLSWFGVLASAARLAEHGVVEARFLPGIQAPSAAGAERLLGLWSSKNTLMERDALITAIANLHPQPPVIRAEQRLQLQAMLRDAGLRPETVRRLIEKAATGSGDLDVQTVLSGLRKHEAPLDGEEFIRMCRRYGIEFQGSVDAAEHAGSLDTARARSLAGGGGTLEPAAGSGSPPSTPGKDRPRTGPRELLDKSADRPQAGGEETPAGGRGQPRATEWVHGLLGRLQHPAANDRQGARTPASARNVPGSPLRSGQQMPGAGEDPREPEPRLTLTAAPEVSPGTETETETRSAGRNLRAALQSQVETDTAPGRLPSSDRVDAWGTEVTARQSVQVSAAEHHGHGSLSRPTGAEPQIQLGQRLVLMSANGEQRTRLNLHPPELGRIHIEISLEGNRLSAVLVTETQAVKELMESHLGNLRQHLAQHDLHLESFQVAVHQDAASSHGQHHDFPRYGERSGRPEGAEVGSPGVEADGEPVVGGPELEHRRIDLFA